MNENIDELKQKVRAYQSANGQFVPAAKESSQRVHLEVWTFRDGTRPVGFEMGHLDQVDLWVMTMHAPALLPDGVSAVRKEPKGQVWTDENGKGANSNLGGYAAFKKSKLTRLEIQSAADFSDMMKEIVR